MSQFTHSKKPPIWAVPYSPIVGITQFIHVYGVASYPLTILRYSAAATIHWFFASHVPTKTGSPMSPSYSSFVSSLR